MTTAESKILLPDTQVICTIFHNHKEDVRESYERNGIIIRYEEKLNWYLVEFNDNRYDLGICGWLTPEHVREYKQG